MHLTQLYLHFSLVNVKKVHPMNPYAHILDANVKNMHFMER